MLRTAKIFALISSAMHIMFFIMESILWLEPETYKGFNMTNEQALTTSLFAFNQGFYNLFLAIGCFYGIYKLYKNDRNAMNLVYFNLFCMTFAGFILIISEPKLILGGLLQLLPPLISLILFYKLDKR